MSDIDKIADPALLARIFRAFGEPDPVAAEPPPANDGGNELARVLEAVDPALVARLSRTLDTDWLCCDFDIQFTLDPDIGMIHADAGGPSPDEPLTYERPHWIGQAMTERTPQAVLRDLHRPVPELGPVELQWIELSDDPRDLIRGAYAEAAAQLQEVRRMHTISRAWTVGQEGMAELAEVLARPWQLAAG